MSDINELNASELEDVAGGKDSDPFRVIYDPHGGCIPVHRIPENTNAAMIPDCVLRNGDHYVVIGETVNEMTPIRVLKNNVCGYIHYSFVYGW